MLSSEQNERLAKIGPGTPSGELMRRYWHPVAATVILDEDPVQPVRILGEDLTLYRDRQGRLGLIGQRCPHRAFDLRFGIPEEEGLRCPYHGWMFDGSGTCVQQPLEPPDSTYKDRVSIKAYPVQEMGGLVWAYLGPEPAPLLPQDDLFVREDGFRQILAHRLPCNWLQVMENRGDHNHATYLHGRQSQYIAEKQKQTDWRSRMGNGDEMMRPHYQMMERGAYPILQSIPNPYGFSKSKRNSDVTEEQAGRYWQIGTNPVLFPYTLYLASTTGNGHPAIRRAYQIGVPIDDTTTWHIYYLCYVFPPEVNAPKQTSIPYAEVPMKDEDGAYVLDFITAQDAVGWWAQGELTDRTQEHLAVSDNLVIEYRQLLEKQIAIVEAGGEPMNMYWEPSDAFRRDINIPCIQDMDINGPAQARTPGSVRLGNPWPAQRVGDIDRFGSQQDILADLYERAFGLWEAETELLRLAGRDEERPATE